MSEYHIKALRLPLDCHKNFIRMSQDNSDVRWRRLRIISRNSFELASLIDWSWRHGWQFIEWQVHANFTYLNSSKHAKSSKSASTQTLVRWATAICKVAHTEFTSRYASVQIDSEDLRAVHCGDIRIMCDYSRIFMHSHGAQNVDLNRFIDWRIADSIYKFSAVFIICIHYSWISAVARNKCTTKAAYKKGLLGVVASCDAQDIKSSENEKN